jgi:hypothetical protein
MNFQCVGSDSASPLARLSKVKMLRAPTSRLGADCGPHYCFQPTRSHRHFRVGPDLFRVRKFSVLDQSRLGAGLHSLVGATVVQTRIGGYQLASTPVVQVNLCSHRGINFCVCFCSGRFPSLLSGSSISNRGAHTSATKFEADSGSRETDALDDPAESDRRDAELRPALIGVSRRLNWCLRSKLHVGLFSKWSSP